jgi:RNA polymerase sigma factor (sigma-70 family)
MTADELDLWERLRQGDDAARKEVILRYLPLVDVLAKRLAKLTGVYWEDLRQNGALGLIEATLRFDPTYGAPFRAFAKHYIRGAMLDSPELTRNVTRRQDEIYRKVRHTENELTQALHRNPTIKEVAQESKLTLEQIRLALDARSVAFAELILDDELTPASQSLAYEPERTIYLREALADLNEREKLIVSSYYWDDQPHEDIAGRLGLTVSNVIKIRQRAIGKLRKRLEVK